MAFKDLYVSDIRERSILWVKIIIICPGFQCYQMRDRKILTFFWSGVRRVSKCSSKSCLIDDVAAVLCTKNTGRRLKEVL